MSTSTSAYSLSPFPLPPSTTFHHNHNMTSSTSSPLGPLASLPSHCEPLKQFKILLLVTSINSFTQRVISYLQYLGFEQVSVQLATSDEDMLNAAEGWDADIVLCPFLTKKLPESIYSRWITLVVHPGPPGDAGPSSLDWVMMGDDGSIPDSNEALDTLLNKSTADRELTQRSHWGTICFQANEELDGGAVWAWEQYEFPWIGSITKAQLYQGQHSIGAMSATIHALIRVYEQTAGNGLDKKDWLKATPKSEWSEKCVSQQLPFLGGKTLDRPLLQSTKRRPNFQVHTAEDILRILNASDSQPGSMLNPLTSNSKSSLFAYSAHLHKDLSTIPASLYTSLGYESFSAIPNGTIIATRQGAIFIKTRQVAGSSAGIWITHGRVPRGKDKPIDPKIHMVEAVVAAGHGSILEGVKEWEQSTWLERKDEWQEVFVRSVEEKDGIAQLVYWNFYNGAFTTSNCQYLLKALQWATAEERGNVKLLVLMGGNYFSNGIALNTIENASSPGAETWANINAIDDLVSFLVGDTSSEVPEILKEVKPLPARGIATVACVRGNAAAGGVALAAACDVVLAGRGVVLNPSYRGMGLHGSELHSYSYLKRCGPVHAATLLRAMKPLNTTLAHERGLVDVEIGTSHQTLADTESLFIDSVRMILNGRGDDMLSPSSNFRCAPWCRSPNTSSTTLDANENKSLVEILCSNKINNYSEGIRDFPPLLHYRNEELSQMLLDSFHPTRSERYHSRRIKFIRKLKASKTPSRYILHSQDEVKQLDEEDTKEFDEALNWTRGDEWKYVNMVAPTSLGTSESTRIVIFYQPSAINQENNAQVPEDGTINDSSISASLPSGIITSSNSVPISINQENEHHHTPPKIERKPSEAPTFSTLHSLAAQPMSPTMSSSSGEGPLPTTPLLMESPPRRINHDDPNGDGGIKVRPSTSNQSVSASKRMSLFRSSSSQSPSTNTTTPSKVFNTSTSRNQDIITFDQVSGNKTDKEKDKKGAFRSIRKKVKNALRALNGESFNPNSNQDKVKNKNSSKNGANPSSHLTSNKITPSRSLSSDGHSLNQAKNLSQSASSHQLVKPATSTTTTNTPVITNAMQNDQTQVQCEWPCLVTGGEEEEGQQSNRRKNENDSQQPLVKEVVA